LGTPLAVASVTACITNCKTCSDTTIAACTAAK
jgi:hypothetical protein